MARKNYTKAWEDAQDTILTLPAREKPELPEPPPYPDNICPEAVNFYLFCDDLLKRAKKTKEPEKWNQFFVRLVLTFFLTYVPASRTHKMHSSPASKHYCFLDTFIHHFGKLWDHYTTEVKPPIFHKPPKPVVVPEPPPMQLDPVIRLVDDV